MPYGPKRLTEKQVEQIRLLYHSGDHTQIELSKKFKLSQSMVCKIVNNVSHIKVEGLSFGGSAAVKVGYKHGN